MSLLRISALAERSAVPTSTLRYYERIGLVAPSGRAQNGYRVYDEATVERLAFIGRAKRLGMSLDDVATLVEAWFAGECEPLQDRLRGFVAGRISELRHQIADDSAFEQELERIRARLENRPPAGDRCGPDCGCDTDPLDTSDGAAPIACSWGVGDMTQRVADWGQLLARAKHTERATDQLRAVFDPSAKLIADLARLSAAETACCPFFTFDLKIAATNVVLTVTASAGAEDLFGRLFDLDAPGGRSPGDRLGSATTPGAPLRSNGPHGAIGSIPKSAPVASARRRHQPARATRTLVT